MDDLELKCLIDGCVANNRSSQEILYKKYSPILMGVIRKYYYKDTATCELILSNAFLRIFRKISLFGFKGSFEGWLKKITYNEIISHYKRNLKIKEVSGDIPETTAYVSNEALSKISSQFLLEKINELPKNTKVVFNLFVIDGFSHKEISKQLRISEGTSKWYVNEARTILKKKLETYIKL